MEVFVLVVFSLYLLLVTVLIDGWFKAVKIEENDAAGEALARITVLVPVRNEEQNIPALLQSIYALNYSNVEVIFVDDHSTDGTVKLLQSHLRSNIRVVSNPGHGKKSAIAGGVYHAHGDIIATTDADCIFSSGWLRAINTAFANPQTKLSFGGVRIEPDGSFFSTLQSIEFATLIGSGASTSALGSPVMCNGANLAYRKSTFLEVNGFHGNLEIASGDDEFLMRKIHEKYPGNVVFDCSPKRIVTTKPADNVETFVHQRIRWASKWKHNTSAKAVVMALFMIVVQLATVALWVMTIRDPKMLFISVLIAKLILEGFFLFRVSSFLNVRWSTPAFLTLQIIYPVYVLIIGIASNFVSFRWKDRSNGLT